MKKEQVSLLSYSPLGGGVLSGKYNPKARFAWYMSENNPRLISQVKRFVNNKTLESTKMYIDIAKKYRLSPVTMAIAWSKQFDFVASTIIGARKTEQLDETLVVLSKEILKECDKVHQEILYPMG